MNKVKTIKEKEPRVYGFRLDEWNGGVKKNLIKTPVAKKYGVKKNCK